MCEVEVVVDHPDLLRKARDRGCWPDLFKNAWGIYTTVSLLHRIVINTLSAHQFRIQPVITLIFTLMYLYNSYSNYIKLLPNFHQNLITEGNWY
jgi:hypothetical protein